MAPRMPRHLEKGRTTMSVRVIEGKITKSTTRIGIVAPRFNDVIVAKLIEGALDGLVRHDVPDENITIVRVPGAFELPVIAKRMATSGDYDAIICLGAIIRGATTHYEVVVSEVSKGIAQTALAAGMPILFGVLTCDTLEQAIERAGSKVGNKGFDCALDALEMANIIAQL